MGSPVLGVSSLVFAGSMLASCAAGPALAPPSVHADDTELDPAAESVIAGVVLEADGTPVSEGWVAVNAVGGERVAVVRTDTQGRFQSPRPDDAFAVTVTGGTGAGTFVSAEDIGSGPLTLRLGAPGVGVTIEGHVAVIGPPAASVLLVEFTRLSEQEGDLFYIPVAADGSFEARLPAGQYLARLDPQEALSPFANVSGVDGERVGAELAGSMRVPAPAEVVAWVGEHAIPITTDEPLGPTEDLTPLGEAFGTARLIGVGESTHGTAEFFRLKHRLFRHLVAEQGVTVLAMEANVADAEFVDAFIQTGRGTVDEALKHLFLVWQTEEIRDLLLWMRDYNAAPAHQHKLRFRGYDVQDARVPLERLRTYLAKVDPKRVELLAPLDALAPKPGSGGVSLTDAQRHESAAAATALIEHLTTQRKRYVARSGAASYGTHLQYARIVAQAQARFATDSPNDRFELRDLGMAENLAWILEDEGPDARVMVWAHNGHIRVDPTGLLGRNMGSRLRERFGDDYLAAGFVLKDGEYRVSRDRAHPRESVFVPLDASAPGFLAEALARAGIPMFALDLRRVPPGPVLEWLSAPHLVHSCGWLLNEAEQRGGLASITRQYDLVLYVDHTTGARPMFGPRNERTD